MITSVKGQCRNCLKAVLTNPISLFLQHKADMLYMNLDETQAEILLTNKVTIPEGNDDRNKLILRLIRTLSCFLSL